jgi:hypothetical protein
MAVKRSNNAQTSHSGKLSTYDEIIAGRAHKQLLGIPNLFVLTITTGQTRLANLLASAERYASAPCFPFKATEESILRKPMPSVLFEPWQRVGLPVLSIGASD